MTPASAAPIVIVGGGQAGGEIAIQLRKLAYRGRIVLVADEPHVPYKRPPLSKAFLAGSATRESLDLLPRRTFDELGIEIMVSTRVARIDRAMRQLHLADGVALPYGRLALAVGSRARTLNLPGSRGRNVLPLRTIADVERLRPWLRSGARLVIIGGGFIGLEVAAVCVRQGLRVTVLEGLPRVLARVTAVPVSAFFERLHREAGVDVRTGAQVTALEGAPDVRQVDLDDGSRIDADVVVVGVGIVPNVELAQDAGLAIDNGIVVDEYARTADDDIVAAGDCTNHPNDFLERRVRLESVQNAVEQARAAAATLAGTPQPYRAVPWFWSDQYDVKLQMVGLSAGYDETVVRGEPAQRSFAVFYLRAGRVIAADAVNRSADFAIARKLVAARASPALDALARETVPLKSLLPAEA